MLRVHQLDMLLHLIENGSISLTADRLGLTQSAVTKSLKEMEAGFSVRLFERTTRGLQPTVYGEVLQRFAHDVVIGLQSTFETIRALKLGERGHVAIGMVPGASQHLIARALQQVRARCPHLSIALQVDGADALLDALTEGLVDFALLHPSAQLDLERFDYVPAGHEPVYALAHPNHPHLCADERSGRALSDCAWAMPPREEPLRQLLESAMASAGFPLPSDILELPLHAGAGELACQLDLVVVLPDSLAQPYLQRGLLQTIALPFPVPPLPFGLLRARRGDPGPSAAAVLRELLQAIKVLRDSPPTSPAAH